MANVFCRLQVLGHQKSASNKLILFSRYSTEIKPTEDEGEFRQLQFFKPKTLRKPRERIKVPMLPPRYTKMPVDQDWTKVWPTARSFNPSVVPFPVRQGYTEKGAPPPAKFGNLELMKIPNFLHLTPPAIKKHCAAIKKFCTEWPKELTDDETCEKYFPIEIVTSDYCHSGPNIRDPRARIVSLQVKLKYLNLDSHAKDKFLRLVGERYDTKTDCLTLVAERCPLKKQNIEYVNYLLTALYYESRKVEHWESEKMEADMERFIWEGSKSHQTILKVVENSPEDCQLKWIKNVPKNATLDRPEDLTNIDEVKNYATAVTRMFNEDDNEEIVNQYKKSVQDLLGLNK